MEVTDAQIYTFAAEHHNEWSTLIIAAAISMLGLVLMVYFLKKPSIPKNRNQNLVIAMLSFFAFTIGGGTAFFSGWTMKKLSDVVLGESYVETGYGKSDFSDISRIYFHNDVRRSLINPGMEKGSTRFLIIEEIEGKTHALSEEHYKIGEIYGILKDRLPR